MKDSGVEWIGKIPKEWITIKVKYVTKDVVTGTTPPGANVKYYSETGLPWFTPVEIGNTTIIYKAQKYLSAEGRDFVDIIPSESI